MAPTMKKPPRLSLFDLPVDAAPREGREVRWKLHLKPHFESVVGAFAAEYGATPVVRIHLREMGLDCYMTHPRDALTIDQATGRLVTRPEADQRIWGGKIKTEMLELPKHISPQVAEVLSGILDRADWRPEITRELKFSPDKKDALVTFLEAQGMRYSFAKGEPFRWFRLFAAPADADAFVKLAGDKGVLPVLG